MLENSAIEERFQVDIFLGDITFETSYSLPGEENPPRVRADISLEWPTWSQSAYRSWTLGEGFEEGAEINLEIAVRLQRLSIELDLNSVLSHIPHSSPHLLGGVFELSGAATEKTLDLSEPQSDFAAEFVYEATFHFDERVIEDQSEMSEAVGPLGPWLASLLVKFADLELAFRDLS